MQQRNLSFLLSILLVCCMSACVRDRVEPCQFHLRFKYDYNMDYVDKFMQEAKRLHLYIFDENERFVRVIELVGDELQSNQIDLELPTELYGKRYSFLAWVGVDDHHIIATKPVKGETTLHDLEVALNYKTRLSVPLEPLMVGEISTELEAGRLAEISMVKNTNTFRIALRTLPGMGEEVQPRSSERFNIYIESNNTRYNRNNEITSDEPMAYYPYYIEDDAKGFVTELSTLRLVEDRHNILVVERRDSQQTLMRIDLNKYLEDLRFLSYQQMPTQEFLDREDEYAVLIFVGNLDEFKNFAIEINGWLIRDHKYDELN